MIKITTKLELGVKGVGSLCQAVSRNGVGRWNHNLFRDCSTHFFYHNHCGRYDTRRGWETQSTFCDTRSASLDYVQGEMTSFPAECATFRNIRCLRASPYLSSFSDSFIAMLPICELWHLDEPFSWLNGKYN
ncbi:unnamed protein product [Ixodes pacificus]